MTKIVSELDMKTKEQKKSKFFKTGSVGIARIQVRRVWRGEGEGDGDDDGDGW